jgi:hypothetical protein
MQERCNTDEGYAVERKPPAAFPRQKRKPQTVVAVLGKGEDLEVPFELMNIRKYRNNTAFAEETRPIFSTQPRLKQFTE